MKIDLRALANRIIKVAAPVLVAALTHRLVTGKLDIKSAALDAAEQALADRVADRAADRPGA